MQRAILPDGRVAELDRHDVLKDEYVVLIEGKEERVDPKTWRQSRFIGQVDLPIHRGKGAIRRAYGPIIEMLIADAMREMLGSLDVLRGDLGTSKEEESIKASVYIFKQECQRVLDFVDGNARRDDLERKHWMALCALRRFLRDVDSFAGPSLAYLFTGLLETLHVLMHVDSTLAKRNEALRAFYSVT
jgi:hypothetical protein